MLFNEVSLGRLNKEDEISTARRTHGEVRNVYRNIVKKSVGKQQLGRSRRKWEDNLIRGLKEIGCECRHDP